MTVHCRVKQPGFCNIPAAAVRDRAAVVATAVLQIVETAPCAQWRGQIETYLRDEFSDIAQQSLNEIRRKDE
jgi:hypothetical protein